MTKARRIVRQYFGGDHHWFQRASARILVTIAWPPAVLLNCWQIRSFRGPKDVPIKRIPGAFWTAMRHNVLPGEYYAYKLWEPDRRVNIDNYLYSNEAARLFKVLNRPLQPDPIGDKLAFHEMCKAQALPTPEVLAAFAETGNLIEFESLRPPERDLFVKPRFGISGHRAERFRWHRDAFESDRGYRIKAEELSGHLATRAYNEKEALLVQPVLLNHPDLKMPNEALATARLVTALSTDGVVVTIFGFIYFPRPNRITAQHGIVALIDVANGRLLPSAVPSSSGAKHSNIQPNYSNDTLILPDWANALQYTKIAHEACANFIFVGWDIAFTDKGPMLLEGNANWSADEYQSLTGEPLGHTKFAKILDDRLKDL